MVVLHRETHGQQRWDAKADRFGFARGSVTAAISLSELAAACTVFPCVMARSAEGGWSLLAITGLQPGHNLFVNEEGAWEADYLPATLASWPFRLVREGGDAGRFLVAVHSPSLNTTEGDALFDDAGVEMPWLSERLRALVATDAALADTSRLIEALDQAGLLHARTLQAVLADGRDIELNGFVTVDETLLAELPADQLHALHTSGALSLAYLHLLSMRRFRALVARASQRQTEAAELAA